MRLGLWIVGLTTLVAPLSAIDWGGSLETGATLGRTATPADLTSVWNSSLKLWLEDSLAPGLNWQSRISVTDGLTRVWAEKGGYSNTVAANLEDFTLGADWFRLGRGDVRDFGGSLLNTRLDGLQLEFQWPLVAIKGYAGTSALLFKSGSTIIMSEDDAKDRQIAESWLSPSTLWASPRLVAGTEVTLRQWLRDQNFHAALWGQYDLRKDQAADGQKANLAVDARHGAPLSTAYLGTGWDGRLIGPVYGSLWGYVGAGTSLSVVGPVVTVAGSGKDKNKADTQYRTWKTASILNGMGGADIMILAPALSKLLVDVGVQLGSWDSDGPTPDQNAAESPSSLAPTTYTGWVGISRTAAALIFNPQAANIVAGQLIVSIKPFEWLQVASSNFVFGRPSDGGISETGLDPASKDQYLGTETDATVLWRPASDVGLNLGFGLFIPNPGALNRSWETKGQLTVSTSF